MFAYQAYFRRFDWHIFFTSVLVISSVVTLSQLVLVFRLNQKQACHLTARRPKPQLECHTAPHRATPHLPRDATTGTSRTPPLLQQCASLTSYSYPNTNSNTNPNTNMNQSHPARPRRYYSITNTNPTLY